MGKRPLYFSRTVGPYADQFGLTGYLEGQGFVRKLHQDPIAESDSIKGIQGLGYVNVPRTEALAFQVYHGDTAARHRPRGWVDKPSEGILATYGIVYQDRKSTRLNSSHSQISYAVFCLKNKTMLTEGQ